jgi:hypothetical protein
VRRATGAHLEHAHFSKRNLPYLRILFAFQELLDCDDSPRLLLCVREQRKRKRSYDRERCQRTRIEEQRTDEDTPRSKAIRNSVRTSFGALLCTHTDGCHRTALSRKSLGCHPSSRIMRIAKIACRYAPYHRTVSRTSVQACHTPSSAANTAENQLGRCKSFVVSCAKGLQVECGKTDPVPAFNYYSV